MADARTPHQRMQHSSNLGSHSFGASATFTEGGNAELGEALAGRQVRPATSTSFNTTNVEETQRSGSFSGSDTSMMLRAPVIEVIGAKASDSEGDLPTYVRGKPSASAGEDARATDVKIAVRNAPADARIFLGHFAYSRNGNPPNWVTCEEPIRPELSATTVYTDVFQLRQLGHHCFAAYYTLRDRISAVTRKEFRMRFSRELSAAHGKAKGGKREGYPLDAMTFAAEEGVVSSSKGKRKRKV